MHFVSCSRHFTGNQCYTTFPSLWKIQIERDGLEKGPKLQPLCQIKPTVLYNPLEGFNNHKRRILRPVKFKFEMPKGLFKEHNPILHLHVADGCSQCYNMKLSIF